MRLVDTSAWIEWLSRSPTGRLVRPQLPERAEWLVPTIVQRELTKWLMRSVGEAKADRVIAFATTCVVAPLDMRLAGAAAEVSIG